MGVIRVAILILIKMTVDSDTFVVQWLQKYSDTYKSHFKCMNANALENRIVIWKKDSTITLF